MTMALQSGELDAAYGLPYSNLILFRDEPYTISSADTSRTFFGQFNGSSEVLQDDRVREAVIGAIVAEWMSGKQGLGYILTYASSTYDTPMLLAGIIVTIILGIATYQVISVLEDKFLYWHESKN